VTSQVKYKGSYGTSKKSSEATRRGDFSKELSKCFIGQQPSVLDLTKKREEYLNETGAAESSSGTDEDTHKKMGFIEREVK